MGFWHDVAAGFLGNVFAGVLLVFFYVFIQWFLQATDITIGYNWVFDGTVEHLRNPRPNFDIRNLSRSRTYVLSNIAYLQNGRPISPFDNSSLWGRELRPGSIDLVQASPLRDFTSLADCLNVEVHVRLQGRRTFWLQGTGPGQPRRGKMQRLAFRLRERFERMAFPLE